MGVSKNLYLSHSMRRAAPHTGSTLVYSSYPFSQDGKHEFNNK
jgi:hypothetical protein